jgi:hypothetical protein
MPQIIDHKDGWGNCSVNFTGDKDTPDGVFNLHEQVNLLSHRSGWNYINELLEPYHNSNAPIFDGFLEKTFSWFKSKHIQHGLLPRTSPWTAFLHNPHEMPEWFNYTASPQTMFASDVFQQSIPTCEGLFVLSDWLRDWLKQQFPDLLVETIYHPGDIVDIQFDYPTFLANTDKKVVSIGWWLRKLSSIYLLPTHRCRYVKYSKCRTLPYEEGSVPIQQMLDPLLEREIQELSVQADIDVCSYTAPVETYYRLSNLEYDILLSKNIGFIDVWDSSANNTVIECIVRSTPLLACRHPAIVEYLGEDYPMYFDDLEHAVSMLNDLELIRGAHEYMKTRHEFVSGDRFINSIMSSDIINNIREKYL